MQCQTWDDLSVANSIQVSKCPLSNFKNRYGFFTSSFLAFKLYLRILRIVIVGNTATEIRVVKGLGYLPQRSSTLPLRT